MAGSVRFRRLWWGVGVAWAVWSWVGDPVTPEWRRQPYGAPVQAIALWVWVLVDSRRDEICAFCRVARPRVGRIGYLATVSLRTIGL